MARPTKTLTKCPWEYVALNMLPTLYDSAYMGVYHDCDMHTTRQASANILASEQAYDDFTSGYTIDLMYLPPLFVAEPHVQGAEISLDGESHPWLKAFAD